MPNTGWLYCGQTYQHTTYNLQDCNMGVSFSVTGETNTTLTLIYNIGMQTYGYDNEYIYAMGFYYFYGDSTACDWNYSGDYRSNFTKGTSYEVWGKEQTITYQKRSVPVKLSMYGQWAGFAKDRNTDNHWANGDFWI